MTAIAATEAAIMVMPAPLREAVETRYLRPHWQSRQCAARMAMTTLGFNKTIERAHWWLAERLSR